MIGFKAETAGSPWSVAAVLFLFMMTPAFGLVKIWPLSSLLTGALTLLSVGLLFGIMLLIRRKSGFHYNPAVFLFLGFLAALAMSVVLNDYTFEATWRWYLISFIVSIMALVGASELKALSPQRFHLSISFSLWFGCFFYGVVSLFEYYGLLALVSPLEQPEAGRLSGIWGQANLTTTTCWLGLLAAAVVFSRKEQKGWWYASILLFGWVLACAASRMSWLMVIGLLAVIFVSRLPRYRMAETANASRLLGWGIAFVVVLLFVVPLLNQPLREALAGFGLVQHSPVTSLINRDAFHDSARLTEFSKVFSAVDSFSWGQLLFGLGPGNYPTFSYRADMALPSEGLVAGTWLHSHNLFSMMFIEFGLIGLVVVLVFIVGVAFAILKGPMSISRFFSIGGIGLLFIHSNLEFPLWYLWFLVLLCLLLTNLFEIRELKGDSIWLKPVVGFFGLLMIGALFVNVGYQYIRITDVALNSQRDRQDYQDLVLFANDGLMGPYAVLRKYRDFAPESSNIDWQLREVRRMKAWQPRDLVVLREFSLLVMKQDVVGACDVAEQVAYRYPHSAPIMMEHSFIASTLSPGQVITIAECIAKGLKPRGETIASVQQKNKLKLREAYR